MKRDCTFGYLFIRRRFAQIAQLVEQRTENPRVTGSIPVLGTFKIYDLSYRTNRFFILVQYKEPLLTV